MKKKLLSDQLATLRRLQKRLNTEAKLTFFEKVKGTREREVAIIEQLIENSQESAPDSCPHCGTTEMLCGHLGVGCTSIKH
jgi:hypothetical protein